MTVLVKELRDALVEAGAKPATADAAAEAVLERQEAFERLATKADLYQVALIQTGVIVGAVVALVKLLP